MTKHAPRWNPALPAPLPETPEGIQSALWKVWYADLQDQRIAAAVVRFPFPWIDPRTGKAVQEEVEELEWVSVGSNGDAVTNTGQKVLLVTDEAHREPNADALRAAANKAMSA